MMSVVVTMRVLVLDRVVCMLVAVRFRDVQQHTSQRERSAHRRHPTSGTVAEGHRERRTDEG